MFKKIQTGTILSALTVLSLGVMATVAVAEPAKEVVSKTTTKTVTKANADTKAKVATKTTVVKKTVKKPATKKVSGKKAKKGSRALERFKAMDSNKNGTISEGEFIAFHKAQFKKKDKNKDSKLTKAEVSPTLAKMKK